MDKTKMMAAGMVLLFGAGYSIGHDRAIRKVRKQFDKHIPLMVNAYTSVLSDTITKNLTFEEATERLEEELAFMKIVTE